MTLNNITQTKLKQWAQQLGFQELGVSGIDLSTEERYLKRWLEKGFHGDMEWMERHGNKRTRPDELEEGTISIISVRMDYLPPQTLDPIMVLNHPERAYVSRYALGRDYHKIMRKKLEKLAKKINEELSDSEKMQYRVFVDSAPVMEKPIAVKAGLEIVRLLWKSQLLLKQVLAGWGSTQIS